MKNDLKLNLGKKLFCGFLITTFLISCQKDDVPADTSIETPVAQSTIPKVIKDKLYSIGVNGDAAVAHTTTYPDGSSASGWLIRDIFIPEESLNEMPSLNGSPEKAGKLFRTTNLVAQNRTYSVNISGLPNTYQTAIRTGLSKYNDLFLSIDFAESSSRNANINVRLSDRNQAQFPTNNSPGRDIQLDTGLPNADVITEIFMHELGHAIGLRHSDFRTRRSCGSPLANEGAGINGAIHIPGTDISGDSLDSIMLACALIGPNFRNQDIVALRSLY